MRTRAKALSPVRIALKLLLVPVVTVGLTASIYIRTSEYPPEDALRHLLSLAGCKTAATLNLAPAYRGSIGYHVMNDPDGDGVACESENVTVAVLPPEPPAPTGRVANGAKFVLPQ